MLKKAILIVTIPLFLLSTLIMPYANFDDVRSLEGVYNHCLKEDKNMDLPEFIGEKLLMAGIDPTENQERRNTHPHQPVDTPGASQIQSGVLYYQPVQALAPVSFTPTGLSYQVNNFLASSQEFYKGIFHPPATGS